jgi:site-specific recombinase XerD
LTKAEVHALLRACSTRFHSGVRMRALVAVMYGSGLRIAETLALFPRDVDLAKGTVRVRNGKGDKTRLVGLDPYACALVERWTERRKALGLTRNSPLFAVYTVGKVGKPLDARYVREALARLGRKAGISKRVHPHGLRHSVAFDLAMSGTPTHVIQAQLGHASLAVTDRYVRHLAPADVVGVMRARDWGV